MISAGKTILGPIVQAAPIAPVSPSVAVAPSAALTPAPIDAYVDGAGETRSAPPQARTETGCLALFGGGRKRIAAVKRIPKLTETLKGAEPDARREAISALVAIALRHPGHVGEIIRVLELHGQSPNGGGDRAKIDSAITQIRRRFPKDIGTILREARERASLRPIDVSRLAKIIPQSLWMIERGRYDVSLKNLFRFCRVLFDHLNLARVYEAVNPKVREIEFYDSANGIYRIALPDGFKTESFLETPTANYLNAVMRRKGLKSADIRRSAGIPLHLIDHILKGIGIRLSLDGTRLLAKAFGEPFDIFYLRLHPEMRFFVRIAVRGSEGRVISSPSKEKFAPAEIAHLRSRPPTTKGEKFLEAVRHSLSRGERDAVDVIIKRDSVSGRAYIELPIPWTMREVAKIDREWLGRRLDELLAVSLVKVDEYMRSFGTNYGSYQELVRNRVFPTKDVLRKLSRALGLPPEVIALWLKPKWAEKVELRSVRRMPEAQATESALSRLVKKQSWKNLSPAVVDKRLREYLRILRNRTPQRLRARLYKALRLDRVVFGNIVQGKVPLPQESIGYVAAKMGLSSKRAYLMSIATRAEAFVRIDFAGDAVVVEPAGFTVEDILALRENLPDVLRKFKGGKSNREIGEECGVYYDTFRRLLLGPFDKKLRQSKTMRMVERLLNRSGHLWVSVNRESLERFGIAVRFPGERTAKRQDTGPERQRPPLPQALIPDLALTLYENDDPRARGRAVIKLGVIALDYPGQGGRIRGILEDWQTRDPNPKVREYIEEVIERI